MPTPKENETEDVFVERCIPVVIEDGTAEDGAQAEAVCHSMYEQAHKTNALKALRATDDELVVGNYIILFGGRDLEGIASPRINKDGTKGEYFDVDTKLESSYTKTGALYVDWEHGVYDPEEGEPGRDDVLGIVDWKTARADENGVFVERVLSRHAMYMQFLERLIEDGIIGTSSEAVPDGVEIEPDGKIAVWPLRRDTLTVTPMEPRNKSDNVVRALKGLAEQFPTVKSLAAAVDSLEAKAQAGSDEDSAPSATAPATVNVNININSGDKAEVEASPAGPEHQTPVEEAKTTEDKTMEEKEKATPEQETPAMDVEAIINATATQVYDMMSKAFEERLEQEKAQEPPVNADKLTFKVTGARADRALEGNPFKSAGEFYRAVAVASHPGAGSIIDERLLALRGDKDVEHGFNVTKALGPEYVGSLYGADLRAKRAKGASGISGLGERVSSDGGFLTGTDEGPLLERMYAVGDLLRLVDMLPISADSNGITLYAEDETSRADGSRRGGIRAYWVGEGASITSSKPKFREMNLKLRKVAALVYCTEELMADSSALGAYINRNVPEELRYMTEDAIINGTGAGQPDGILNCPALISTSAETGQSSGTIVSENIVNMWARLWAPSRRNAVWLIDQGCEPQLFTMALSVGTGGLPVYMPPGGLSASPYATLMGRPVIAHEYGAAVGTVGDILLVDLGEYQMIEKGGVEAASSMHVLFIYDELAYRFIYRVDGQSKWNSALTPNSGGNTQSPFVGLASR